MYRTSPWWGPALMTGILAGVATSCAADRDCQLTASCEGGAAAGGSGAGMSQGGSGGSGGQGVDETPPTLVMTAPADGEGDVTTRVSVTATFSEPLDASTVTSDSFVVTSALGEVIAGVVSYDTSTGATFVPDEPLALLAGHTMMFTAAITDLAGNALADAPLSAAFTTVDGTWESPQLIETSNAYAVESPQVALAANGDIVAVWATSPDGFVFASRFSPTTNAWSTPVAIDGNNATADPQVGIDAEGHAVAVWRRLGGAVWASAYEPSVGWSPPEMVQLAGGQGHDPRLAMAANGEATAAWQLDHGGGTTEVWTNRFTVGVGWDFPTQLSTSTTPQAPDVAVDQDGNGFVLWHEGGGFKDVLASRFVLGSGWSPAQVVGVGSTPATFPRVAVSPAGDAMVVWTGQSGGNSHVWASRFFSGLGWEGPVPVESNPGGPSAPSVAMDAAAAAVVVWEQAGTGNPDLWANSSTSADGWATPQPLEIVTGSVEDPQVAMDDVGNAMAVWTQYDGTRKSIWSDRRDVVGAWAGPQLREMSNAGDAESVQIAVTPKGNAVAVWRQSDGVRFNAWASIFREPPTN